MLSRHLLLTGIFAAAAAPTWADPSREVAAWGDTLAIDSRIPREIERFEKEFTEGYPERIAKAVRELTFEKTAEALDGLANGDCVEFIQVEYLEPGFASGGERPEKKSEREFEEGFIYIECLACFEVSGVSAEEALREYTDPEFRMRVAKRIERIFDEEGLSCVETNGVKAIMRPTLACNLIEELHRPGFSSQHSQVVSGGDTDSYQTVYFKESLKTLVEIPGGVALHYVNYTRAKKLGKVKRLFGKGKIASSQEKAIQELRAVLRPPPE